MANVAKSLGCPPLPWLLESARRSSSEFAPAFHQKGPTLPPSMGVNAGPARVAEPEPELSFADIFRQHARYLWRALLGLGVRPADVDDVCQEVLLVVHRRLPEFDGRALRSWLYAICLRVASEYRRSARVRGEVVVGELRETQTGASQLEEVYTNWTCVQLAEQ